MTRIQPTKRYDLNLKVKTQKSTITINDVLTNIFKIIIYYSQKLFILEN